MRYLIVGINKKKYKRVPPEKREIRTSYQTMKSCEQEMKENYEDVIVIHLPDGDEGRW